MDEKTIWNGKTTCDFCHKPLSGILFNGKTINGLWAVMCPTCHSFYGYSKFGNNFGEMYKENSERKFVKVKG